jgi:hypothetical protein
MHLSSFPCVLHALSILSFFTCSINNEALHCVVVSSLIPNIPQGSLVSDTLSPSYFFDVTKFHTHTDLHGKLYNLGTGIA